MTTSEGYNFDLKAWIHPELYTAASSVDGTGLHTRSKLPQGTVLIRFGGRLLSADLRYDDSVLPGTAVGVSESTVLAEPMGSTRDPSDFINHSCDPNLGMLDAISIHTVKDVAPGSELYCDYAYWETSASYVMKRRCRCQAIQCRGTITGLDWQLADRRVEMLQHASPFIRRRILAMVESE